MNTSVTYALALALAWGAAAPDGTHRPIPLLGAPDLTPLQSVPPAPEILVSVAQSSGGKWTSLQNSSRLEIIRYIDGEFVKALKPLPGGKDGLKFNPTKPFDPKLLSRSLQSHGEAVHPGDTVQITKVEFRNKQIVIDVNGGGKKHFHPLQHLQVGVGSAPTAPVDESNPAEGNGSTIVLDYGKEVPDLSPEDLKQQLSGLLDFSSRSAAVNWVDTLPPEFKEAIQERRAVVGMDHEMVLAAMGRPDHKVRERDPKGEETEDWIYGDPPARTVFVTFEGDKVVRVKDYD